MTKGTTMTGVNAILLAALYLEEETPGPWCISDLTVKAWGIYPEVFGLPEYRDKYPDSNRVKVELYKKQYSKLKGLVEKVGENRYLLTDVGRRVAARLHPDYVRRQREADEEKRKFDGCDWAIRKH